MKDELDHLERLIKVSEADVPLIDSREAVALAKKAHAELSECIYELKSAVIGLLSLTGDEPMEKADSAWDAAIGALELVCGEGFNLEAAIEQSRAGRLS